MVVLIFYVYGNAPGRDPGYGTSLPSNYKKSDGKPDSSLSGLSGYASSTLPGYGISQAGKSIGNGIKTGATNVWNWLRGK